MPIKVIPQTEITMLDPNFVSVVNDLLKDTSLDASEIVALNFRDPSYDASNGGYHPVEIHVDSKGDVLSITDFAYFGVPPFVELGIELDWSFEQDSFRQFDDMYDLEYGRSLLGGFHRIRHYGLLANSGRRGNLKRTRELLLEKTGKGPSWSIQPK